MIDTAKEPPISLTEASRSIPPIDGKRPHVSTIWRWISQGSNGVYLEHVRVGNLGP